jgi:hypothetical protein
MVRKPADQGAVMTDHNYPDGPPRPQSFTAGGSSQHRTPGLPQSTLHAPHNGGQETPSQAIVAAGKRVVEIVDGLGRRLKVKFISGRDRMMLAKAIGAELAKNEVYLGYATLAWAVVELDNGSGEDTRIMPMVKPSEVEFLVDRLGDEGLAAVGKVYTEHFADLLEGVDVDIAKN